MATLDHKPGKAGNSCQIYIHNVSQATDELRGKLFSFQPPISVDEFNMNNQKPAMIVEGDVMLKEYQFIVEQSKDKLLKICRVKNISVRKYVSLFPCLGCP